MSARGTTRTGQAEKARRPEPKKNDQVLDLAVLVHPRDLDKATIRSLLGRRRWPPAEGRARQAEARDNLASTLEAPRKSIPTTSRSRSRESRRWPRANRADRPARWLAWIRLVEQDAAGGAPSGRRANARQRAEAARQVPLWLVARECKKRGITNPPGIGDNLAARAVEAARRQTENTMLMALIREQGEIALAGSRHPGAAAAWGRMLELVVDPAGKPAQKARRPPEGPCSETRGAGHLRSAARHDNGARTAPPDRSSHLVPNAWASDQIGTAEVQTAPPAMKAAGLRAKGAGAQTEARRPSPIEPTGPHARTLRAGHADRQVSRRERPA